MTEKQDRRVGRTIQLLREALFSLIREKGFENLTVQEILDRANVGRATFYAHFENKEDLLVRGFEALRTSLGKRQREALAGGRSIEQRVFAFSRDMFAHANEFRDVYQATAGKPSGVMIRQILHKLLVDLVRVDIRATVARDSGGEVPIEARVQFVAGGFYGLLNWWMEGKMRLSVEDVDKLFRRFAIPAVKVLRDEAYLP